MIPSIMACYAVAIWMGDSFDAGKERPGYIGTGWRILATATGLLNYFDMTEWSTFSLHQVSSNEQQHKEGDIRRGLPQSSTFSLPRFHRLPLAQVWSCCVDLHVSIAILELLTALYGGRGLETESMVKSARRLR